MNPVLERLRIEEKAKLNESIQESVILQEASRKLEEWSQLYRVCSCKLHSLPVVLIERDGTATFMCGCRRKATHLE